MKDSRASVIAETDEGFEFDISVSPERALSSAVLFDAVQNLLCVDRDSREGRVCIKRTFDWISDSEDDFPFSFMNVCDALALDEFSLRVGLINAYMSGGVFH